MIPLKDNLRYLSIAWVSVAIFAVNVLVYIVEVTLASSARLQSTIGPWLTVHDALVAGFAGGHPMALWHAFASLFCSVFLHASFMHLFGNMCFFFTFAPALEARMGHIRFLAFYLVAGVVAAITFALTDPTGIGHGLGASGAIGGVLGAYLIYFPRARVNGWSPLLTPLTSIGAFFLADFFMLQWFSIWQQSHMSAAEAGGVGYWAHIGGITFGMAMAALLAVSDVGRLKVKDLLFYLIAAGAVVAAFTVRASFPAIPFAVSLAGALAVVTFLYARRFQRGALPWWKVLATPLTTTAVALLLVVAMEQAVEVWMSSAIAWQTVHVGVIAALVMIASIVATAAARQLPLTKKPIVIVPVPKPDERILGEVAVDLVVGFCRFWATMVSSLFGTVSTMARPPAAAFVRWRRNQAARSTSSQSGAK